MAKVAKVAIVTGAGAGIGRAVAVRLAREGYELVLVARREERLVETAEIAGKLSGRRCEIVAGDVADAAVPGRLVERAVGAFGRVDAIVHCAGVAPLKPIGETTDEDVAAVLAVNLVGFYRLVRAGWGELQKTRGSVVGISSQSARDPFVGFSAYAAAKGGMNSLVAALHREGMPFGIRAHSVAPGAVETEMLRGIVSKEQLPSEKVLSPEEVADVVFSCVAGGLKSSSGETIYLAK